MKPATGVIILVALYLAVFLAAWFGAYESGYDAGYTDGRSVCNTGTTMAIDGDYGDIPVPAPQENKMYVVRVWCNGSVAGENADRYAQPGSLGNITESMYAPRDTQVNIPSSNRGDLS